MTIRCQGTAVSGGIAVGTAVICRPAALGDLPSRAAGSPGEERDRFRLARDAAREELAGIARKAAAFGQVQAEVVAAQAMMIDDPLLTEKVETAIADGLAAEHAVAGAIGEITALFAALDDEYMRARAKDIEDIGRRLLGVLQGRGGGMCDLAAPAVIIADDLLPSDTALLDPAKTLALATAGGGKTSHTAIIARTMGIPAVVGAGPRLLSIADGDTVVVDGTRGLVVARPDESELADYTKRAADWRREQERLRELTALPSLTTDGKHIEVAANIGTPKDIARVIEVNADGIGLFRSEFLFMDRRELPSEEEQLAAYKEVLAALPGKRVIIRTLDAGGDKELGYLGLAPEANPALGLRAIRLCLARSDLFKTQLRALLRAGLHGQLAIMFPMIASLEELQAAKAILGEAAWELADAGVAYRQSVPVGVMIEVPAAALIAEELAREVDFFSIGTNDLVQYTMAVDRMNSQVAYLGDYFQPAVVRLIARTARAATAAGIFVGMCGEMAGDPLATPLLVGLGLSELSVSAGSVLAIREAVRRLDSCLAGQQAGHVLSLTTAAEVKDYLRSIAPPAVT